MVSLAEEINCAVLSGKDVSKELRWRNYRQRYDGGYATFISYDSDKKQVRLSLTEWDGDIRPLKLPIEEASRFDRIEGKPSILPPSRAPVSRGRANQNADIGD